MEQIFHMAQKKIPFASEDGSTVKPDANNGVKLEGFIFDVFPMSSRMVILEAIREEEFAPVKNASGSATDSPDTARAMVSALHRQRATDSGAHIDGPDDAIFEISPLLSYSGEGVAESVAGRRLEAPANLE